MPKIFISYRRDDTQDIVGRIYDRLTASMGKNTVYYDVDTTPYGMDYRQHIRDSLSDCTDFLIIIGERFISQSGGRLHEPSDTVRIEIECALKMGLRVIPVLIRDAAMPSGDQLPTSIKEVAYRNAFNVRSGRDFEVDMKRLIDFIGSQKQVLDKIPSMKIAEFNNVSYANPEYYKSRIRNPLSLYLNGALPLSFGLDNGKLTIYNNKINYTGKIVKLEFKYTDIMFIAKFENKITCWIYQDDVILNFMLIPLTSFWKDFSSNRTSDLWSFLEPYLDKFLQIPPFEEMIERGRQSCSVEIAEWGEKEVIRNILMKCEKYYTAHWDSLGK